MKASWTIAIVFVLLAATPAAAKLADLRAETRVGARQVPEVCRLDPGRAQHLHTLWNDLARRHMLAMLERRDDPAAARAARRDIAAEVARLRRAFGPACVLDIL